MTDTGRGVMVVLLLVAAVVLAVRSDPEPAALGAAEPVRACEVPVEYAGSGVRCLSATEAARAGLVAGDRLAPDGRRDRMAPARVELFAVPLDVNRATAAELASLPHIGPALAERIAAGRPFASVDEIARVPGIGVARLEALRPRLRVSSQGEARAGP